MSLSLGAVGNEAIGYSQLHWTVTGLPPGMIAQPHADESCQATLKLV